MQHCPKGFQQEQAWEGTLAVLSPSQPSLLHCEGSEEEMSYIFHVGDMDINQEINQRKESYHRITDFLGWKGS